MNEWGEPWRREQARINDSAGENATRSEILASFFSEGSAGPRCRDSGGSPTKSRIHPGANHAYMSATRRMGEPPSLVRFAVGGEPEQDKRQDITSPFPHSRFCLRPLVLLPSGDAPPTTVARYHSSIVAVTDMSVVLVLDLGDDVTRGFYKISHLCCTNATVYRCRVDAPRTADWEQLWRLEDNDDSRPSPLAEAERAQFLEHANLCLDALYRSTAEEMAMPDRGTYWTRPTCPAHSHTCARPCRNVSFALLTARS